MSITELTKCLESCVQIFKLGSLHANDPDDNAGVFAAVQSPELPKKTEGHESHILPGHSFPELESSVDTKFASHTSGHKDSYLDSSHLQSLSSDSFHYDNSKQPNQGLYKASVRRQSARQKLPMSNASPENNLDWLSSWDIKDVHQWGEIQADILVRIYRKVDSCRTAVAMSGVCVHWRASPIRDTLLLRHMHFSINASHPLRSLCSCCGAIGKTLQRRHIGFLPQIVLKVCMSLAITWIFMGNIGLFINDCMQPCRYWSMKIS